MSRIRSSRYITKIYNSSDCTKYTSIQYKDLCNITKHKFYPNAVSITLQSAKLALITSTLLSKREYIISSINQITNREVTIYGAYFTSWQKSPTYISLLPKNTQNENFHLYKNNRQIENITDTNREIYI